MSFWNPDSIRAAVAGTWLVRPPLAELPPDRPTDLPLPPLHAPITGVSTDSRTLARGQVFVALRGLTHDGHDHLRQAAEAGAPILIVDRTERMPASGFTPAAGVLKVADTGKALLRLAAAYRKSLRSTRVIAVCGSNGKTTTTRLIDAVLRTTLRGTASIKSFNNAVGVPLTILAAKENDQYLVCEVGTNAPGEILELAQVVEPDIAVITSIGREHLEGFGDVAGVAREEATILRHIRRGGAAVVTGDSPELEPYLKTVANAITFGRSAGAALRVSGAEHVEGGVKFLVNGRVSVRVGMLGEHNALNAVAALAVARRMNIAEGAAIAALASAAGPEMRLEMVEAGGLTILNDAYNANPDSAIAAIRTMAAVRATGTFGRSVVVLGEMREMGAASEEGHRAVARELAQTPDLGLVVLVGPGAAAAREELAARGWGGGRLVHVPDTSEPNAREIAGMLRPGDLVLLKGSRAVRLERIIEALDKAKSEKRRANIEPGQTCIVARPGPTVSATHTH